MPIKTAERTETTNERPASYGRAGAPVMSR